MVAGAVEVVEVGLYQHAGSVNSLSELVKQCGVYPFNNEEAIESLVAFRVQTLWNKSSIIEQ